MYGTHTITAHVLAFVLRLIARNVVAKRRARTSRKPRSIQA